MLKIYLLTLIMSAFAFASSEVYVNEQEENFCLNFLPSYLDSMPTEAPELITFNGTNSKKSVEVQFKNKRMIMFTLAQVSIESGWASAMALRNNNYWGLGGNYTRANGCNTFMQFSSFENGHSYLLNHMAYGLTPKGSNHLYHPGWPKFIDLIQRADENISYADINKALNSGPFCKKFPAYNTDRQGWCAQKDPKHCPCIDYAKMILTTATQRLTSKCLATYDKYFQDNMQTKIENYIDHDLSEDKNRELIHKTYFFLLNFVNESEHQK